MFDTDIKFEQIIMSDIFGFYLLEKICKKGNFSLRNYTVPEQLII